MNTILLEDVLLLLEELVKDKTLVALRPDDNVYQQYAHLGSVDGVRSAIKKIQMHYERELYSRPR